MRGSFLVLLVWVLAAVAAAAGPWPREAGRSFVVLGSTGQVAELWAERGIGGGRWLVLDGWYDRGSGAWQAGLAFHKAMRDRGAWKLAWSAGLAVGMPESEVVFVIPNIWFPSRWEAVVKFRPVVSARAGFSMGRALAKPWPGWAALDLRLEADALGLRAKAGATLGYRPRAQWAVIGQVQAELGQGVRPDLHLAPSVVWQPGRKMSLELGLRHSLRARKTQVKLGSWMEF